MKKLILVSAFASINFISQSQVVGTSQIPPKPVAAVEEQLGLKEQVYDFGKIPQGKPVYYSFDIVNTGKAELKLDNVQASCGCTTAPVSRLTQSCD